MKRPTAFANGSRGGIAAQLAAMTADRDAWKARALAAEAGNTVAASARRLRALRVTRKASPARRERGLFG